MTTIGSALIPLVHAQQQRALAFPQEGDRLQGEARVEQSGSSQSLDDKQRSQLNSRAATLTRDEDLAGMTSRARRAVQAYQSQIMDPEREQISHLLGVDTYA